MLFGTVKGRNRHAGSVAQPGLDFNEASAAIVD
jgi:hypothetical protein